MADEISYNASDDINPGEPQKVDKDYIEIIESNVDDKDPKIFSDQGVSADLYYYSPEHKKIVWQVKRQGKKLKFTSAEEDSKGSALVWGTQRSLQSFYKLQDEDFVNPKEQK